MQFQQRKAKRPARLIVDAVAVKVRSTKERDSLLKVEVRLQISHSAKCNPKKLR